MNSPLRQGTPPTTSVVSNASPLILLAKADLLQLLPALFSEVFVPQAVREEILDGPPDDPMRKAMAGCAWVRPVVLTPFVAAAGLAVGTG